MILKLNREKENDLYFLFERTLVVSGVRIVDMAEIAKLKGKRKVYERFMKSSEESVAELHGQDFNDENIVKLESIRDNYIQGRKRCRYKRKLTLQEIKVD